MPYDGKELNYSTQALIKARDLLEGGWCQRHGCKTDQDGNMSYCIEGSIVFSTDYNDDEILKIVEGVIRDNTTSRYIRIWNDDPERTKEEVLDMMDKAIVRSMSL